MHALITGASSGIGDAIARRFARAGWKLTLAARREAELHALAERLDVETFVRPTDLSDLSQCAALVADAQAALGPIDVLVNNAGVQYVEPAVGVSHARAERLFNVDLLAPIRLIHEVAPAQVERQRGIIINIASMAGITTTPGMTHYSAAKAALGAMSEGLRAELAHSGVHVLTVYPGPVHSPMESAARDQLVETFTARHTPTGDADELADLIYRAAIRHQPRLIYPRSYGVAWYTRAISQWVTERFAPPTAVSQRDAALAALDR